MCIYKENEECKQVCAVILLATSLANQSGSLFRQPVMGVRAEGARNGAADRLTRAIHAVKCTQRRLDTVEFLIRSSVDPQCAAFSPDIALCKFTKRYI